MVMSSVLGLQLCDENANNANVNNLANANINANTMVDNGNMSNAVGVNGPMNTVDTNGSVSNSMGTNGSMSNPSDSNVGPTGGTNPGGTGGNSGSTNPGGTGGGTNPGRR